MSLDNFFSINMPYGLRRNQNNEWFAFNREFMPLGWNSVKHKMSIYDSKAYKGFPIHTRYLNITNEILKKLAFDLESCKVDDKGDINMVFLYDDRTNPSIHPEYWENYLNKIVILSSLKTS